MEKVSSAALQLLTKVKDRVHIRHYIICEYSNVEVGDIRPLTKKEIAQYAGLSVGYTRKLLRELCDTGYVAFFHVGDDVKIVVNPSFLRVSDYEPSRFIVSTFRDHQGIVNSE